MNKDMQIIQINGCLFGVLLTYGNEYWELAMVWCAYMIWVPMVIL